MKKNTFSIIFLCLLAISSSCKERKPNHSLEFEKERVKEDFINIMNSIKTRYAYLDEKTTNIDCLEEEYFKRIPSLKSKKETLLFFENLLNEFYDSHINLNANTTSSYRLFSPIYAENINGKSIIKNVWSDQVNNFPEHIIGAEILTINNKKISDLINQFPTICNNKKNSEIRTWIANKIIAGKYDEARNLKLRLVNGDEKELNLDSLKIKQDNSLLNINQINNIGVIRINNSLGDNSLITAFDNALDNLFNTRGLVLDLRNTIDGGNSYVARGIMSRFINKDLPYQKHVAIDESWDNQPNVGRGWVEYVSPRGNQYKKPVVVLVGKWTGSMGEGIAVGFDGMKTATIVGSEMAGLAGAISSYNFKYQDYGYRLSTEKLYHIDGTVREKWIPVKYIKQTSVRKDEALEKAIELLE